MALQTFSSTTASMPLAYLLVPNRPIRERRPRLSKMANTPITKHKRLIHNVYAHLTKSIYMFPYTFQVRHTCVYILAYKCCTHMFKRLQFLYFNKLRHFHTHASPTVWSVFRISYIIQQWPMTSASPSGQWAKMHGPSLHVCAHTCVHLG